MLIGDNVSLLNESYLWAIWLERNRQTFQGESKEATFIIDLIVSKITLWAARCKELHGYDAESIMRS